MISPSYVSLTYRQLEMKWIFSTKTRHLMVKVDAINQYEKLLINRSKQTAR